MVMSSSVDLHPSHSLDQYTSLSGSGTITADDVKRRGPMAHVYTIDFTRRSQPYQNMLRSQS